MNAAAQLLATVESQPVSRSLTAALSAALAIDDQPLANWIRLELSGYYADNPAMSEAVVVPVYRTVNGLWFNEYGQPFMTEPALSFVNDRRLREGASTLEGLAGKSGPLTMVDPHLGGMIQRQLGVDVTRFVFDPAGAGQVLANIRARLIEQVVERRETFKELTIVSKSSDDVLLLKPSFYGIGVDLKELWRRFTRH